MSPACHCLHFRCAPVFSGLEWLQYWLIYACSDHVEPIRVKLNLFIVNDRGILQYPWQWMMLGISGPNPQHKIQRKSSPPSHFRSPINYHTAQEQETNKMTQSMTILTR